MQHRLYDPLLICFAMLPAPGLAHAQEVSPEASAPEDNSGQDPTRPVTRVDVRVKDQEGATGSETGVLTLRADKPFTLRDGWKLATRLDLPLVETNTVTAENPTGKDQTGLGDILLQALFVSPQKGKAAFALGGQLIVPTGSDDQFTTGKWQFVPTAAAVYQLPEVSRGSFVALVVRDAFSFAGDDDRPGINNFGIQPIFNWQLPQRWFVTFAPEAKFNTKDDWKLFLPFDVTVGTKLGPATVMSLQGDVAIVDDYRQYDWQLELRLGFFF